MNKTPTEEQAAAKKYVMERPLPRPKTDLKKAIICAVCFELCSVIITVFLRLLFGRFGVAFFFSEGAAQWEDRHPILFTLFMYAVVVFAMAMIFAKTAAIGLIKMYRHYSPENIRRKCMFKPTCSEYAILAIEKYGLIIGLCKAYFRLFRRCKGTIYRIDYP